MHNKLRWAQFFHCHKGWVGEMKHVHSDVRGVKIIQLWNAGLRQKILQQLQQVVCQHDTFQQQWSHAQKQ